MPAVEFLISAQRTRDESEEESQNSSATYTLLFCWRFDQHFASLDALDMLRTLIVPAKLKHEASIIFLHGFAASAVDWHFLSSSLDDTFSHVKFIFPQA
jgi:hypothetical protein